MMYALYHWNSKRQVPTLRGIFPVYVDAIRFSALIPISDEYDIAFFSNVAEIPVYLDLAY